jgi:hypothetical protein
MKPGDLVQFNCDQGRFDINVGSKGLVLGVRKNPFCLGAKFEFDALVEGKIVKDILSSEWVEVISEAG